MIYYNNNITEKIHNEVYHSKEKIHNILWYNKRHNSV